MSGDCESTPTDTETLAYLNRVAMGFAPCYQRTRDEQLKARALVNKARPPFDQEA